MTAVGADPYVPGHGDRRFAVRDYHLELDYKVTTNHLRGVATLEVVIEQATTSIELDLYGLTVTRVLVDGRAPRRFSHRSGSARNDSGWKGTGYQ